MYIKEAVYRTVPITNLTFPVSEGTILTVNGNVANQDGSDAYGIVPENIYSIPTTGRAYVAVGGIIDLDSEANRHVAFSEAMIQALGSDFNFVRAVEVAGGGEVVPEPSASDVGKALVVQNIGTDDDPVYGYVPSTVGYMPNIILHQANAGDGSHGLFTFYGYAMIIKEDTVMTSPGSGLVYPPGLAIDDEVVISDGYDYLVTGLQIPKYQEITYNGVVVYPALVIVLSGIASEVSGGATSLGGGSYMITGDCEITIGGGFA